MFVIGTAGHVDHGKSTLVEALTGIDPDRWREEKERQMTIDLGFAWLSLDGLEEEVGVIDVPGHRDFIDNMLAGIGGIDLALFVVAADEGVMPQTREHLAILDLLEVHGGVIALTKSDLIQDADWLELVTLDVAEVVAGTVLTDAPILPVSAKSGQGLAALKTELASQLASARPRPDLGRPRLPIDRAFSLPGFGTIVTGTLVDGSLRVGDSVEIQPGGHAARVRGLQTHKTPVDRASPGSRVAVNLTGIAKESIQRGDVLALPGHLRESILIDVTYRHLPDAGGPLKHNSQVKLFVGAAETMARCRVIGARQIPPGEEASLQLALTEPLGVARGDRLILRQPSPPATLGGGRVLDACPGRRHRRFRPQVVTRFRTLAEGTPAERLLAAASDLMLARREPASLAQMQQVAALEEAEAAEAVASLCRQRLLRSLDWRSGLGDLFILEALWQDGLEKAVTIASTYHDNYPLRMGIPREELRNRLQLTAAHYNALLGEAARQELLVDEGDVVRRPEHMVQFTVGQQQAVDRLMARFQQAGANAPSVKECIAATGDEVYNALILRGELVAVGGDVVYRHEDYQRFVRQIRAFLNEHKHVSAAEVRDLLQTSRKYAIAMLEHLDNSKVTRRVGDYRELLTKEK